MKRPKVSCALADVVTLLHTQLLRYLWRRELSRVLAVCGDALTEEVRDFVATSALREFAEDCACHFGAKCAYDWYQLVPKEITGAYIMLDCSCMKVKKETKYMTSDILSDMGCGSDCDYTRFELPHFPEYEAPPVLPLPHILDARAQLLEAGRLVEEMHFPAKCGSIFQLADLDDPEMFCFGTFQPMFFSLTTVLEAPLYEQMPEELKPEETVTEDGRHEVRAVGGGPDDEDYGEGAYYWEFGNEYESESEDEYTLKIRRLEQEEEERKLVKRVKWLREAAMKARIKPVDVNNIPELKKLLNKAQRGFGTRFFKSTIGQERLPYGVLEQHWNGIDVNLATDTSTCRFCSSVTDPLLQQHCKAVFQPLKRYMLRHFQHVRYVRPPKNWRNVRTFEAEWYLDLIAGLRPVEFCAACT